MVASADRDEDAGRVARELSLGDEVVEDEPKRNHADDRQAEDVLQWRQKADEGEADAGERAKQAGLRDDSLDPAAKTKARA